MSNLNKVGIIGLTDDKSLSKDRGLQEIGVLFKGTPKKPHKSKKDKQGNPIMIQGDDLDYFRLELKPDFAHLEQDFIDLYGDKPTVFNNVQFFLEDVDDAFFTAYEAWDAAQTLLHRCDGVNQHLWYDKQRGKWNTARIACRDVCRKMQAGDANEQELREACSHTGRLKVLLMDFHYQTGAYGYFRFETGSTHDIINLYSGLHLLHQQFGTLIGIPFILGRSNRQVSTPMGKDSNGDVKRGKTIKSLMNIRPTEEFVKKILLTAPAPQRVQRLTAGEAAKALGSGDVRRVGEATLHRLEGGAFKEMGPNFSPVEGDVIIESLTDPNSVTGATVVEVWHTDEAIRELVVWALETKIVTEDVAGLDDFLLTVTGKKAWSDFPTQRAAAEAIRGGHNADYDFISIEGAWDTLSLVQQESITKGIFWDAAHDVLTVDSALTPELLAEAVQAAVT